MSLESTIRGVLEGKKIDVMQIHRVLAKTKNSREGIQALKKAFRVNDAEAKKLLNRAMNEEKDKNEYDQEGEMAKTQLRGVLKDAEHMIKMFGDEDNLPEWVQAKIIKAADYLKSAHDYMMNKDESVSEAKVEMCPEKCCGKPVTECSCGPDCPHCDCYEKNKMREGLEEKRGEGEADTHIIMQLRKAQDLNGNHMITFRGGKKAKVDKKHIDKILKLHNHPGMKPDDKRKLRVMISKSPADLAKLANQIKEDFQLDEGINQKKFAAGAKAMKAYAMKHGGVDKADFMKVADSLARISRINLLQAGQELSRLNRLVDNQDTDVRERIYIELKKVGLVEALEEKTLTPAEKKKREEVAKAIERDNPDMPMDKKMAIATATAKKVAEATVDTSDIEKRKHISKSDTEKLSMVARMMSREKVKRQRDLANKARQKGDHEMAKKHDDAARKLATEAAGQYKATSEKSKFKKGYRAHLVNPQGKTSYLGGTTYKTAAAAAGEAQAYHDRYFNTPGMKANERGADRAVHDYKQKNKSKIVESAVDKVLGIRNKLKETKGAPKGYHFTRDGKLKKGDAGQDGPGGKMLRSDPLDKQRNKIPPLPENDK